MLDKALYPVAAIPFVAAVYHGNQADFTFDVDMIASDPPWRQGNLSYWSHQEGIEQKWIDFVTSMSRHFVRVNTVYLKIGRPEREEWMDLLRDQKFKNIVTWDTRYYAGRNAQILASNLNVKSCPQLEWSPKATNAVALWAADQSILSVADPCVGKGVMLAKFKRAGMMVLGVELVKARAVQAAARLCR